MHARATRARIFICDPRHSASTVGGIENLLESGWQPLNGVAPIVVEQIVKHHECRWTDEPYDTVETTKVTLIFVKEE